jgi:hypothetical protein
VRSAVLADDGKLIPVEISSQVVQLGQGRESCRDIPAARSGGTTPDQRATKVGL